MSAQGRLLAYRRDCPKCGGTGKGRLPEDCSTDGTCIKCAGSGDQWVMPDSELTRREDGSYAED